MKYIVMERHESYVIVLDEQGRFFKVANMDYSPGQTLTKVVPMEDIKVKNRKRIGFLLLFMTLTALIVFGLWFFLFSGNSSEPQHGYSPDTSYDTTHDTSSGTDAEGGNEAFAVFRMYIGGEISITCNSENRIITAEGLDEKGKSIISNAGIDLEGTDLTFAAVELLDKAYDMGYVNSDSEIFVAIEGEDDDDNPRLENIAEYLEDYAEDKYDIEVEKSSWDDYLEDTEEEKHKGHEHNRD